MKKDLFIASRLFNGDSWQDNQVIVTHNGLIEDIISIEIFGKTDDAIQLKNPIVPSFIDVQVYGAAGKLLAAYPEAASLAALYQHCRQGGTHHFLAAVATNTYDTFYRCIDAVRDYRAQGGAGCLGLHIEGPWISKEKRGAHIESLIFSPTIAQATELLDYGKDVIRMITLAPETCSPEVIRLVQSRGIVVSAGHSNISFSGAMEHFDAGIPAITHLYNAMSPFQHRAPGLVGAAFLHNKVSASIIPDGYHVDFAAVRLAKQVMKERLFVITDAVTDTDKGYYPHQRAGDKYESSGILSGSALTMRGAVHNLVQHCGIGEEEALRMCSLYPAQLLGLEKELGRLRKGWQASWTEME